MWPTGTPVRIAAKGCGGKTDYGGVLMEWQGPLVARVALAHGEIVMIATGWLTALPLPGVSIVAHPLAVGDKVLSVLGEYDHDEDDNPRSTGPLAVGEVVEADRSEAQGWRYRVEFGPVWVFLDQTPHPTLGSIDSPTRYRKVARAHPVGPFSYDHSPEKIE